LSARETNAGEINAEPKTNWRRATRTFVATGVLAVLLPVGLVMAVKALMGPMITRDNASIAFREFQSAIDTGAQIRDPRTATAVATEAYRNKTGGILLDGWNHPMHIYAVVQGTTCQLNIQSAGPDGNFGDGDDLTIEKQFDLVPGKSHAANGPSTATAARSSTEMNQ
jgi:hypothetical protein